MKNKLVDNIRNICSERNISLRKMEDDLEFSPGLISRWTRMSPSIDKIIAVADYLGVSLDMLVGRGENSNVKEFARLLYEKTEDGTLEWRPCGYNNPIQYPINRLKELQGTNWMCMYYRYLEGYFLMAANLDDEDKPQQLAVYILADDHAVPVKWSDEFDVLIQLFESINNNIVWVKDDDSAKKLIERFIITNGEE